MEDAVIAGNTGGDDAATDDNRWAIKCSAGNKSGHGEGCTEYFSGANGRHDGTNSDKMKCGETCNGSDLIIELIYTE